MLGYRKCVEYQSLLRQTVNNRTAHIMIRIIDTPNGIPFVGMFLFFLVFFFFFVCIQNYLKTSVTAPKQFTSKPEFIEQSRFLKFTTTSILHCTRTVDSRCILRVHLQNGTPYVYTRAETENLISINRHILLAVTCIQTYITLVRVRGTRYTHTHTRIYDNTQKSCECIPRGERYTERRVLDVFIYVHIHNILQSTTAITTTCFTSAGRYLSKNEEGIFFSFFRSVLTLFVAGPHCLV